MNGYNVVYVCYTAPDNSVLAKDFLSINSQDFRELQTLLQS